MDEQTVAQRRPRPAASTMALAIGAILFALGLARVAWQARAHAPDLVCIADEADFGSLALGREFEHVFRIKNRGSSPRTIAEVLSSCHCTSVTKVTFPTVLRPGEELDVPVRFEAAEPLGRQVRVLHVKSDDLRRTSLPLVVQGTVRSQFRLSTPKLDLGELAAGREARGSVSIETIDGSSLRSIRAASPMKELEVATGPSADGRSARVSVTSRGPLLAGEIRSYVTLEVAAPRTEFLHVLLDGRVGGPLVAEPPTFEVPQGERVSRTIVVRRQGPGGGRPGCEWLGVEPPDPGLRVTSEAAGQGWKLLISADEVKPLLNRKAIRVETSCGALQIPILVHVHDDASALPVRTPKTARR